jgi:hypothetical protein
LKKRKSKRNHKPNQKPICLCAMCHRDAAARLRWEAEQLAKHGYYFHFVLPEDDEEAAMCINAHTHGLSDTFAHPDLQIVFPVEEQLAGEIFEPFVCEIRQGKKFNSGDRVPFPFNDEFEFLLVDAIESGRPVLRIIIPDNNGRLAKDEIDPEFRCQYGDL